MNLRHFPKEPSRAATTKGLGASASPAAPCQSLGGSLVVRGDPALGAPCRVSGEQCPEASCPAHFLGGSVLPSAVLSPMS